MYIRNRRNNNSKSNCVSNNVNTVENIEIIILFFIFFMRNKK